MLTVDFAYCKHALRQLLRRSAVLFILQHGHQCTMMHSLPNATQHMLLLQLQRYVSQPLIIRGV